MGQQFFAATVSTAQTLVKPGRSWYARLMLPRTDFLRRLFGIGPLGMTVSFAVLAAAFLLDRQLACPAILADPLPLRLAGIALAAAGFCLLGWGARTLRSWWKNGELCTGGPFRWFRHPIYAAYLTFLFPAAALLLNSWPLLITAGLLHPLWHLLVRYEEAMMLERFAEQYRDYMGRTGRFIPRISRLKPCS